MNITNASVRQPLEKLSDIDVIEMSRCSGTSQHCFLNVERVLNSVCLQIHLHSTPSPRKTLDLPDTIYSSEITYVRIP